MSHYEALTKPSPDIFPKLPPARGVLGVARIPEPSVQIKRGRRS